MLTTVILAIFAVLSYNVRAQLSNSNMKIKNENFENSFEEYSEENEFYPDFQDYVWFEIESGVPELLLTDDDVHTHVDYEKFNDVRGIPVPTSHKLVSCFEKLDGPFLTIESTSSDEHIYPARYYNISCVRSNDVSQHRGHNKKLPVKCEAGKRECVTTIKEVPVFRKQLKSHNKNCWKPEKIIPVETGCKCVSSK